MARWKLMTPHYIITTDPAEWEEVKLVGGKQLRIRHPVPRYLDPRDPADWNSRWGSPNNSHIVGNENGEIIVCIVGKGAPSDHAVADSTHITPDMMPLDDEARAISDTYADRWSYKPIDSELSFSQAIDNKLNEFKNLIPEPAPVKIEGFQELMAAMAKNQEMMITLLAGAHQPQPAVKRI
jgi:hypothetical protein